MISLLRRKHPITVVSPSKPVAAGAGSRVSRRRYLAALAAIATVCGFCVESRAQSPLLPQEETVQANLIGRPSVGYLQLSRSELKASDQRQPQETVQLDLPSPDRVFRAESEETLRQRIRLEARQLGKTASFPDEDPTLTSPLPGPRPYVTEVAVLAPHAVAYNPLYFEDKNTERYGWDAGIFQPIVSTAKFWVDTAMLPYNMGVLSPRCAEYNTGYYLPGDPAPYMIYVPRWSWKGAALQTGAVVGGIAAFP